MKKIVKKLCLLTVLMGITSSFTSAGVMTSICQRISRMSCTSTQNSEGILLLLQHMAENCKKSRCWQLHNTRREINRLGRLSGFKENLVTKEDVKRFQTESDVY